MKYHFIDLITDVKAILGKNGLIWVYYSTIKLDNEYFTDDTTKINSMNKHETPTEYAAVNIILFKNIIKSLDNNKIQIDQFSLIKYYDIYIETIGNLKEDTNISDLEHLKRNTAILKTVEKDVIPKLKAILQTNINKTQSMLSVQKDISSVNNLADQDVQMNNQDEEEENEEEIE
jgi:hypothetical protein